MPKLDGTHIFQRLRERLEELRQGKEVAARDLRALLTEEQEAAMDAEWAEQQALRKKKRARTKEEEVAFGWKTKREIHIEAYEKALVQADEDIEKTFEKLMRAAEVRAARIYMKTLSRAIAAGKTKEVAEKLANNNLTRAGLRRMDGVKVGHYSKRDREVWEMERKILQRDASEMTEEELEQIELIKAHEKSLRRKIKKI